MWRSWKHSASTPGGINSASARTTISIMIYPHGSLGQAYARAMALRAAERKAHGIVWTREQRARDDWPRSWRWIGPAFGDYAPLAVVAEDLLALRAKVAERVSESEAFRVIKTWRALWAKLTPLGYTVPPGSDPSLTFANSAPAPRQETWSQHDVARLVQRAWREGYYGLAALLAVGMGLDAARRSTCVRSRSGNGAMTATARCSHSRAPRLDGRRPPPSRAGRRRFSTPISPSLASPCTMPHPCSGRAADRRRRRAAGRGLPAPTPAIGSELISGISGRLVFGPHDQRQIQDMRRSGAVEAMRGDASPSKLSAKMANTLSASNRLHRTYIPVDIASVRDVDEARAVGRERNRGEKLQLRSVKKLQPK